MKFEDDLFRARKRTKQLDQMVASDDVGLGLVGALSSLAKEQRAFLNRWGNINNPYATSPLTILAARLGKEERRREALFLLNLVIMIEVRRVLDLVAVNDEFTMMAKAAEERESDGQLYLDGTGTNQSSESQAVLLQAQEDYDLGLRNLTANWPEKVNTIFPDRLEIFDPGDYLKWNVEIREQLVRLCLDSDFPVKERTTLLCIVNSL